MVHHVSRMYESVYDWGWNEPYYENEPITEAQVNHQIFLIERLI